MTDDEWNAICLHIEMCWKSRGDDEFDDVRRAAYHTFLCQLDAVVIMAALHRLVQNGTVFRPTPGEIMAVINADPSVPSFSEALVRVKKALRSGGSDEEINARLSDEHRYVRIWVERYGPRRLALEPIDDPEYGGAIVARLQKDYERFCETAVDRERQGRSLLSTGEKRSGLNRFDPLAALGNKPKEIEAGNDVS